MDERDIQSVAQLSAGRLERTAPLTAELLKEQKLVELWNDLRRTGTEFPVAEGGLRTVENHLAFMEKFGRQRKARFQTIVGALRSEGVPFCYLKGEHIAQRFYGRLGARFVWDIDLLVPPHAIAPAERALTNSGFQKSRSHWHARTWADGDLEVDIHTTLKQYPAFRWSTKELWEERVTSEIMGMSTPVLSDYHTIVFHLIGMLHDLEHGKCKLKELVDLDHITRDLTLDWEELMRRMARDGVVGPCLEMLSLWNLAFERDWEPQIQRLAERHHVRRVLTRREYAVAALLREEGSVENKSLFLSIYPGSGVGYRAWWILMEAPRWELSWEKTRTQLRLMNPLRKRGSTDFP